MNLSVKQKQNYRCRKQTYEQRGVRKGEINWEIGIDMYTLLCIKQIASKDLCISKHVKLCSVLCAELKGKKHFKSTKSKTNKQSTHQSRILQNDKTNTKINEFNNVAGYNRKLNYVTAMINQILKIPDESDISKYHKILSTWGDI